MFFFFSQLFSFSIMLKELCLNDQPGFRLDVPLDISILNGFEMLVLHFPIHGSKFGFSRRFDTGFCIEHVRSRLRRS